MIEIKGVKKSFGENHILKGVDLDIKDGEVIVILGPSGSGKTTFLRCISFLEKADEGKWIENGAKIDLHSADKKQIQQLRRKSGFVFQNYNLFANKTVLENVTLGLTVGEGVPKGEAEKRAMEALKKVGMADRVNFYPNALSGGQQQRLCIARALAVEPQVLLMDEPASALDPIATRKVEESIVELKEGLTIIIVTHSMQQAARISDRTAFFYMGRLVESDSTDVIFTRPSQKETEDYITGRFG